MDSVHKLIYQAFEHVDKSFVADKLGSKFLEMLDRDAEKSAVSLDKEDPEFAFKIKFLRECEQNKDLAWVLRSNFHNLSFESQTLFNDLISPLVFSSGVYFQYSKLQSELNKIFSKNYFNQPVYVLDFSGLKELVPLSLDTNKYNWMNGSEYNRMVKECEENLYITVVNTYDGLIIKNSNRGINE